MLTSMEVFHFAQQLTKLIREVATRNNNIGNDITSEGDLQLRECTHVQIVSGHRPSDSPHFHLIPHYSKLYFQNESGGDGQFERLSYDEFVFLIFRNDYLQFIIW